MAKGRAAYEAAQAAAATTAVAPTPAASGGAAWNSAPVKSAAEKGKETRKRHQDQKASYAPNVAAIERVVDLIANLDGVDIAVLCAYVLTVEHVRPDAIQQIIKRHGLTRFPGPAATPSRSGIEELRRIAPVDLVRYTLEALLVTQAMRARDYDPGKTPADSVLALYLTGLVAEREGAA